MPTRTAEVTWEGSLQDGSGDMALESGAFEGPYDYASRFEEGETTNPEELIGAALSGCFSMALAKGLTDAGFEPRSLHVEAAVHLDPEAGEIDRIELTVEGEVPDADETTFREHAEGAKQNCPVSKALAGPDIEMTASLA